MSAQQQPGRVVEVSASDLPLHCPTPKTPVWSMHPRVFLDVERAGETICPYCSTRYVYKGAPVKGH
ncbi:MAG: zinc-finger domain-containing protein [Betaproteobacteria bacterium]|nr:zinc-finger domain-containing protein [Betaproteobacteria bacterium]